MAMPSGTAEFVVAAATGGLLALLPKIEEVRSADRSSEIAHDLHTAQLVGGTVVLALAGAASVAQRSATPFVIAAVGLVAVVATYEWVLRGDGLKI